MGVKKNQVCIYDDRVVKHFMHGHNRHRRLHREVEALRRLSGLQGVPGVLAHSTSERFIVTERLAGSPLADSADIPDTVFTGLRALIEDMLAHGVARHSLPPRDVIVLPGSRVGLVDFERCTLRSSRFSPAWWVACIVTRFHLMRLIDNHAPHLLTHVEQRRLRLQLRLSTTLRRARKLRQRYGPS